MQKMIRILTRMWIKEIHRRIVCKLIKTDEILINSGTADTVPAVPSASSLFLYIRILGRSLWLKDTAQLVFFLWFVKYLKNLWIIDLFITSRNVDFCLISSMVSGLLDQLKVVSDRIGKDFNRSGATQPV